MMAAFWEDAAAAWSFTYLNIFPLYIYMSYFIYISPSTTDPPFRGGALMKLLFKKEEIYEHMLEKLYNLSKRRKILLWEEEEKCL